MTVLSQMLLNDVQFRLSGILLQLLRTILGCARTEITSVRLFQGNLSILKFYRAFLSISRKPQILSPFRKCQLTFFWYPKRNHRFLYRVKLLSFFNCFAASAITLQFHCLNFSNYVMSNGNSRVRVVPLSLTCNQVFKIRLIAGYSFFPSFVDLVSESETRTSGSQQVRSRFALADFCSLTRLTRDHACSLWKFITRFQD